MQWLVINDDQLVVNVVEWDGVAEWAPPQGYTVASCADNPGVHLGWKKVNGTWTAPVPDPPTVPASVPMNKARKQLIISGLSDAVQADLEADTSEQGQLNMVDWNYAPAMVRTSPLVESVATSRGLTDDEIDALFIAADKLD